MNASDKTEMSSVHINKHKQTKKQNLTHREKEKEKGGEERREDLTVSPKGKRKRREREREKKTNKREEVQEKVRYASKRRIDSSSSSLYFHFITTGINTQKMK